MSKIKVNSLEGVGASTPAINIDNTSGAATANLTALNSGQFANRNVIINGEFQINQRGNKTGVTSSTYTLDRWYFDNSNAGTYSISKSGDRADGFINSCKIECTSTDSQGSGDFVLLQQKIEGLNVQRFAKGTSSAKDFALSFYIKTNKSGVYTVELRDNNNSRTCSKTFTVSDGNWNRYILLFPADTTGALNNNNNDSLQLSFWLGAGSDYTSGTLQTAWGSQTNANRVSSSNVFMGDSTSNEWYITGVQLEVGSFSTEFEHKSVADDLLSCQRYYQISVSETHPGVLAGRGTGSNTVHCSVPLACSMRAVPSLSESNFTQVYAYLYDSRPHNGSSGTVTTQSAQFNPQGAYLTINVGGYGGSISDDRIVNIGGYASNNKLILNSEL